MNIFEKGMTIGWAVSCLKAGRRVRRAGWNGKGMFLLLVPGSRVNVTEGRPLAKAFPVGTEFNYLPHVDMWTAQGDLVPWLCSQTDLLAEDWEVVEDAQSKPPWIEWTGGRCPTPPGQIVEVRCLDGSGDTGPAGGFDWAHVEPGSGLSSAGQDIVGYREV